MLLINVICIFNRVWISDSELILDLGFLFFIANLLNILPTNYFLYCHFVWCIFPSDLFSSF